MCRGEVNKRLGSASGHASREICRPIGQAFLGVHACMLLIWVGHGGLIRDDLPCCCSTRSLVTRAARTHNSSVYRIRDKTGISHIWRRTATHRITFPSSIDQRLSASGSRTAGGVAAKWNGRRSVTHHIGRSYGIGLVESGSNDMDISFQVAIIRWKRTLECSPCLGG
ncbi:hypothetical protein VTK56DRAFT_7114 [Thermocarpiscus australiensis]